MSPLAQAQLLLSLLAIIRDHLAAMENANLCRTVHGAPYISVQTERGTVIASVDNDGLYALNADGSMYACDSNASQDTINNTVRTALNDARENWT